MYRKLNLVICLAAHCYCKKLRFNVRHIVNIVTYTHHCFLKYITADSSLPGALLRGSERAVITGAISERPIQADSSVRAPNS